MKRGLAQIPAALLLLVTGAAHAGDLKLAYDFYAGGVEVMVVEADATLDPAHYTAHAQMRTEGPLSGMYAVNFSFSAEGEMRGSNPLSRKFEATYAGFAGNPAVHATFSGDGPQAATVDPALPGGVTPDELLHGAKVMDPLTGALLTILSGAQHPCGRSYEMFDGVRHYRLVLAEPETNRVERYDGSLFEGDALSCAWRYELVAAVPGDWAIEWFGKTLPEGKIWFAPWPGEDGKMMPVKLLAATPIINVVMHLRAASADGKAVQPN